MQKKEIIDRKFSHAFEGYDVAEVDFFLDELYREFTLMEHEIDELHAKLSAMQPQLDALPEAETPKCAFDDAGAETADDDEQCFIQEDEAAFISESDGE